MPRLLFRGVLNADKYSFLDGPALAVYLLVNNVKLVGVHGVSCGGAVEMYGGLEVLLDSFPLGSARFPYVGTGAVDVWTLVLVDDPCLTGLGVLVLGVAQSCSEDVGTLEVDLDASAFTQSFDCFLYNFC